MNSFDIDIHCNFFKCRKVIGQQKACVTSCSHIFCLQCANDKFSEAKVCPACDVGLTQKKDIVLIQLSPTEEYKSSILAGLKPDVIMDICNRALSFYNYQVSQELCYRISVQKMMESQLETHQNNLQYATREHQRTLKAERDKLQTISNEFEKEKRRNHDLQVEIQSKATQFTKLQQMYEKLKRKAMGSMIQQSVHDNLSSFNPPPINRANSTIPEFENHSHYQPYQSIDSYRLTSNHRQMAPSLVAPSVVDPTRRDTLRHPQKTQIPLPTRKSSSRRPSMSVIGLNSNQHSPNSAARHLYDQHHLYQIQPEQKHRLQHRHRVSSRGKTHSSPSSRARHHPYP
ncbi:hypothetical protein BC941DRAFT_418046 [Chlamydoabsidia padenii]|nr:hypothetical protein BC941DRAFT_418046 [Chlamydoabsidia padenii]